MGYLHWLYVAPLRLRSLFRRNRVEQTRKWTVRKFANVGTSETFVRETSDLFDLVNGTLISYSLKTSGGPLTRFTLRSTVTSTRLAILTKGMLLFIP
jgi:hypothetical protein